METYNLPVFRPLSRKELRQLYTENPSGPVRHLVLEVERYRRVISVIDSYYQSTHKAWRDTVGGDLTALHMLKQLLHDERERRGD